MPRSADHDSDWGELLADAAGHLDSVMGENRRFSFISNLVKAEYDAVKTQLDGVR